MSLLTVVMNLLRTFVLSFACVCVQTINQALVYRACIKCAYLCDSTVHWIFTESRSMIFSF